MTNRYIIGMFYDAAYLSRQLIARIIEPLAVLELCGQFYAYNKYATLSLQTLVLWDFSVQQALIDCSGYIKRFTNPGKSRFSGVFLYLNGLIWFDQIWQNESRFHPIFSGPQVVNWPKRGQKEGEVVPKVVNREPIFGVLFSPPFPRFLAVAVWHSLS